MDMTFLYWIPLLLPAAAGLAAGLIRPLSGKRALPAVTLTATALSLAASVLIAVTQPGS